MKYLLLITFPFLFVSCCGNSGQEEQRSSETTVSKAAPEGHFGKPFSKGNALSALQLPDLLADKNSVKLKLSGEVVSVCQMTGCWLDMETGNGSYVHVTFADDGFVVPKDIAGKKTTIEGIASKELISVDFLRRQAKNEGKSQEEIDAITVPSVEYSFVATGVMIED